MLWNRGDQTGLRGYPGWWQNTNSAWSLTGPLRAIVSITGFSLWGFLRLLCRTSEDFSGSQAHFPLSFLFCVFPDFLLPRWQVMFSSLTSFPLSVL